MGEETFTIILVFNENHSQQKTTSVPAGTDIAALQSIAKQKFQKKIKSIFTQDRIRYHPALLKNQLKLFCSVNELNDLQDFQADNDLKVQKEVFAIDSYIPDGSIAQLYNLTEHYSNVTHLLGMPDLHQGKQCPIGAVVITKSKTIHPDLVGEDIGCGMAFYRTDKVVSRTSERQLEQLASRLYLEESILNDQPAFAQSSFPIFSSTQSISSEEFSWDEQTIPSIDPANFEFLRSAAWAEGKADLVAYLERSADFLGTIGAGNHFAELQEIDKIFIDPVDALREYQLDPAVFYLTVHSGSRGIGERALHEFQDGHLNMEEYKQLHDYCLHWAQRNRYAIASRFLCQIGCDYASCGCVLDLSHNFCEFCSPAAAPSLTPTTSSSEEDLLVIHRKGAAPAYPDRRNLIVIPGSRGTKSYLVRATDKNSLANGFSVSHGAGRKFARSKAMELMCDCTPQEREKKLSVDESIRNNIVICEKKELFYEEAPFAYKDVEVVVQDLVALGLCEVVASLKPVITYKTKV